MRFIKFLGFIIFAYSLVACDNLTEEIHLNSDGSGEYTFYSDMIPSMTKSMAMFAELDSTEVDSEQMIKELEEELWAESGGAIDSIMSFDGAFDASVKDDPKAAAFARRVEGFMKGTQEEGKLNTGMRFKFKDLSELNYLMQLLAKDQQEDNELGLDFGESESTFSIGKKSFSRSTIYTRKPEINTEGKSALMMMLGEGGTYTTIIHLPKNVKSVKGNNIKEKSKRKVIFEYSLLDIIQGKANTDFDIKLKRKL